MSIFGNFIPIQRAMLHLNSCLTRTICLGMLLLGFAGCEIKDLSTATSAENHVGGERSAGQVQSTEVKYAAIVRQGEKIGHTVEKVEHLTHDNRSFVRMTSTERVQVQRAGQALEMQVESVFLETPQGQLRQFVTKIDQAGAVTRFQGQVSPDGQTLNITTQSSATRQPVTESLPWGDDRGGLYAVQRLFQQPPLAPGEIRTATVLVPTLNQSGEVRVEALQKEATTLLDGASYELLKARYLTTIAGQSPLEANVWLDDTGDIVKMTSPVQGFEIYRCSREYALSNNKAVSFDLAVDTVVPVQGKMPNRTKADSASYRITLRGSEPGQVFASQTNQSLKSGPGQSATLQVFRIRPHQPLPPELSPGGKPQPEDSASSSLVQVEDPQIQRLARQVDASEDDPWRKAVALETLVHRLIRQKDFSRGFLSAADVAEQKVGDCTEHAVLLMALLRAHDIPARGALGLVYVDHGGKPGFAYHMWTEAWIGDRWIPLDATRGEGGIDVGYIKVTQASLNGSGAFAAFLPVSQVIGQLEIEVMK